MEELKFIAAIERWRTSVIITKLWGGPWFVELDGGGTVEHRQSIKVQGETMLQALGTAIEAAEQRWGVRLVIKR